MYLEYDLSKYEKNIERLELNIKINKDNSYISKLENKKINIPIDVIEKIARELKIEITDLFL